MKIKNIFLIVLVVLIFSGKKVFSQEDQFKVGCIAFYNLENLFDTIKSPDTNDEEYTPEGKNNWDTEKYNLKLAQMSEVICQIGTEFVPTGPAILGVSEIENRLVLEDLIKTPKLAPLNYQIVHFDSPDERGVDVGLLYQPKYFTVTNSKSIYVDLPNDDDDDEVDFTRDILLVSGLFDGEPMHFFVNHWSSRRGGEKRSAPLRNKAADVTREHIDSIMKIDPNAKIIVMGDFNDNPNNESVVEHLGSVGKERKVKNGLLFNPMQKMFKSGQGTGAYRDTWHLFDQLIFSEAFLGEDKSTYKFHSAKIFKENFLIQQKGRFEGYPFRTSAGGEFLGGYSDHFPVYLFLIKKK